MSRSDGNAVLVNVLSSSVRSTLNGMETAPGLIRRVLEEESWRQFTTPRGEEVTHDTFESFVTSAPTGGLGQTLDDVVRLIGDDEDTLDLLARALGVPAADLRESGRLATGVDPVERDARDFGAYARSGGWIFGLLVARNVQPASGQGKKSEPSPNGMRRDGMKVSAKKFAEMAGTSTTRVMRFYRAWECASEAGVVPGFGDLVPDVDVELPDADLWGGYFASAERSTERRQNISAQAEAAGTSFAGALHVAHHPSDLKTAILADAKTAEVAREALMQRMEEDSDLQAAMARTVTEVPQLKKAVAAAVKRTDQLEYVRKIAEEGTFRTPAGQVVDVPGEVKAEAGRRLAEIGHRDADPAESVAEVYEAVNQLMAESIEADPEIKVRERRARFYSSVRKVSKVFEQLDLGDLSDAYEVDMLEELESLQKTVAACIESLREAAPHPALRAVDGF